MTHLPNSPFAVVGPDDMIEAEGWDTCPLDGGSLEVRTPLPYQPLFANPLDHIRAIAAQAGLTLDEVIELAKDIR